MEVGPDGLRRAVALAFEPPDDDAALRRAAGDALALPRCTGATANRRDGEPAGGRADETARPGLDGAAGLAALSVVLTALRRGENGVRAWPLRGEIVNVRSTRAARPASGTRS